MMEHPWRALYLGIWVGLLFCFALACSRQPEFKPVGSIKQIMVAGVGPSAEVVFDSVGTVVSAEGVQEIAPKNEEEWANVRNHALMLAESGNLLLMGGRAKDRGKWAELSRAMIATCTEAFHAAEARNAAALLEAGGRMTEVCDQCHELYRPPGQP
jgi:hypothetical protein